MKLNKTISALALMASASSAHAIVPPHLPQFKSCVDLYLSGDGANYAGTCDQTENNKKQNKKLNEETGCTAEQALITSYDAKLPSCMPVGMVQL